VQAIVVVVVLPWGFVPLDASLVEVSLLFVTTSVPELPSRPLVAHVIVFPCQPGDVLVK
jgi:hypothetical protein